MTTADKLRELRSALGLTQAQAAKGIGLNKHTYVNYECCGTLPSLPEVERKIAAFYGTTVEYLFNKPRTDVCCAWCGQPIPEDINDYRRKYCSAECRKAATAERARQWRKTCLHEDDRTESTNEQWDPKTETYTEYKLRVFPRYRDIYIRPGGRK